MSIPLLAAEQCFISADSDRTYFTLLPMVTHSDTGYLRVLLGWRTQEIQAMFLPCGKMVGINFTLLMNYN